MGNLENQIVSWLNRGVALLPGYNAASPGTGDWLDSSKYYVTGPGNSGTTTWNHYAQFFHQTSVSIDGKNYGFAFDDQQGKASDIGVGSFSSVTITLGAWTTTTMVNGSLLITGTNGNDTIQIQDLGLQGVKVIVNGKSQGTFAVTTSNIIVQGLSGKDLISITRAGRTPAAAQTIVWQVFASRGQQWVITRVSAAWQSSLRLSR